MVWGWLSLLLALLWAASAVRMYRKALHGLQYKKGLRFFFRLQSAGPSTLLPSIPYISLGYEWPTKLKHKVFSSRGSDVINCITCFPSIQPGYLIADPLTIQEIFSDRNRFQKYREIYDNINVFGVNIISAEGEVWKKHKKAVSPSLSEKNNRMVWEESVKAVNGLIDHWGDKECVEIDHVPEITVELALRVISGAGFGRFISWDEDDQEVTPGHKYSFRHALHIFVKRLPLKIVTSEWMSYFSTVIRETHETYRDLNLYMEEMIDERRRIKSSDTVERHDIFNAILASNEGNLDDGTDKFTNEEVFANMFVFLFAGHETTAHSLAYALGLLAIHEDEQEKLYKRIIETLNEEEPAYDQMNSFSYVLATFYEVLRLYPAVPVIPKQATEDTTIPMRRSDGVIEQLPVAKGCSLLLDVVGLHYNPKYWPDPEKFDPSRYMGKWNKDAYIPFSGGSRRCIGRRFGEIEAVASLIVIIKNFKIELRDSEKVEYAGLNEIEKRAKLLKSRTLVTSGPVQEPLVFRKRGL